VTALLSCLSETTTSLNFLHEPVTAVHASLQSLDQSSTGVAQLHHLSRSSVVDDVILGIIGQTVTVFDDFNILACAMSRATIVPVGRRVRTGYLLNARFAGCFHGHHLDRFEQQSQTMMNRSLREEHLLTSSAFQKTPSGIHLTQNLSVTEQLTQYQSGNWRVPGGVATHIVTKYLPPVRSNTGCVISG
jgi:hypothetical protein